MAVNHLNKTIFVFWIALVALPSSGQTKWRFPVTIEALQDVPGLSGEKGGQRRGVLYVSGGPFTIRKGQRFLMLKIYSEGECRIRFENREYDVSSCPWLDGFTDHQEDVFKVVSEDSPRQVRESTHEGYNPTLRPTASRIGLGLAQMTHVSLAAERVIVRSTKEEERNERGTDAP